MGLEHKHQINEYCDIRNKRSAVDLHIPEKFYLEIRELGEDNIDFNINAIIYVAIKYEWNHITNIMAK